MHELELRKLTPDAHALLASARATATTRGHLEVDLEHVVEADLRDPAGLVAPLLAGAPPQRSAVALLDRVRRRLERRPVDERGAPPVFAPALEELLDSLLGGVAFPSSAGGPNAPTVGREARAGRLDLLAAIAGTPGHGVSVLLDQWGLTRARFVGAPKAPAPAGAHSTATRMAAPGSALATYCVNLTERARRGELTPVAGRDRELADIASILSRRDGPNPVMVGDPGVGKTALVEGLAQQIVGDAPPPGLVGVEVHALDLGALLASTRYRGDFEERLKQLIDELRSRPYRDILFIDELHSIVGLGRTDGAMDGANLLKPALSRCEIRVIGATTWEEFRHIEKDAALRRRFTLVDVGEPDVPTAIAILQRVAPTYAAHHGLRIEPAALARAVQLASHHLPGFLPGSAIALVDETLARFRHDRRADPDREPSPLVCAEDIERRVAARTGLPLERIRAGATPTTAELEAHLEARVYGQPRSARCLGGALQIACAGLSDPNRPLGAYMFVGPSGVGKTETVMALAKELNGDDASAIVVDMTNHSEAFTVAGLIGAPPGYVGFEQGGALTERVRRRRNAVVLFDEFDKAHLSIVKTLMPVLERGQLTDAVGRDVSFRQTVVVFTSNAGSAWVERFRAGVRDIANALTAAGGPGSEAARTRAVRAAHAAAGGERLLAELLSREANSRCGVPDATAVELEDVARAELQHVAGFPPEFLGRLDAIVVFDKLGAPDLSRILDRLLLRQVRLLAEHRGLPVPAAPAEADAWFELAHVEQPEPMRIARCREPGAAADLLRVSLAETWCRSLLARAAGSELGARALTNAFRAEVVQALATRILATAGDRGEVDVTLHSPSQSPTASGGTDDIDC